MDMKIKFCIVKKSILNQKNILYLEVHYKWSIKFHKILSW